MAVSPPRRIHLTGASGSGTTTLGRRIADHLGLPHVDTDDFFWQPTEPRYQTPWPMPVRLDRLRAALAPHDGWVLSGSLAGWGDPLIPLFDAVVFLAVPAPVRLARLRARERERYGAAIDPGGARHAESEAFIAWAAGYDDGDETMRSRNRHERWLADLPCPVIRLEGTEGVDERLRFVVDAWGRSGA